VVVPGRGSNDRRRTARHRRRSRERCSCATCSDQSNSEPCGNQRFLCGVHGDPFRREACPATARGPPTMNIGKWHSFVSHIAILHPFSDPSLASDGAGASIATKVTFITATGMGSAGMRASAEALVAGHCCCGIRTAALTRRCGRRPGRAARRQFHAGHGRRPATRTP
jgi:hypothetical protein